MIGDIVEFTDLQRITGKKTSAEVAAQLTEMGVPFIRAGRSKPFTTTAAINAAMGVDKKMSTQAVAPVITVE